MPNWCWNATVFYGEKEVVIKFKEDLLNAISENPKFKPVENSWDNMWLGNMFLGAGYSEEEVLNGEIRCRGWIDGIGDVEGGVSVSYESAWTPIIESINKMIREKYKGLKQVTIAEEQAMGVFVNTDYEGIYFPERYYLDYEDEDGNYNDVKYYEEEEKVVKIFNEQFKTSFKSFDECYNNQHKVNGNRYICLEAFR